MTKLDEALVELRQNMDDPKCQSKYYDLFLNASFFVPTWEEEQDPTQEVAPEGENRVAPLILEYEGNDYLLLFDTLERLNGWAKKEVTYVEVPGHVLAATSADPLHWALNVETEFAKPFIPAEIAWLKEVVEQCEKQATGKGA
ncbi:hypothetical protein GMLC_02310 [Geomonas limicola]|uniref:SseB protein N-terminal domain-containing protein n=1 Tax=Geomonas limicola TaxID=2740186 RepID=A0A6V8N2B3_9BACT|nr:SseB family protein [Geomonas limicola]GFO66652.1 hypothetical protein GMLC_02310 [Geomonas limicola]